MMVRGPKGEVEDGGLVVIGPRVERLWFGRW